MTDYEKELDKLARKLNEGISSVPVDGYFKLRISNPITNEDKAETKRMLEVLAKALGRPDVTIIVESKRDLN
jgi:hypothetical protein